MILRRSETNFIKIRSKFLCFSEFEMKYFNYPRFPPRLKGCLKFVLGEAKCTLQIVVFV